MYLEYTQYTVCIYMVVDGCSDTFQTPHILVSYFSIYSIYTFTQTNIYYIYIYIYCELFMYNKKL